MAHALVLSIRRFGGAYADAPVILTIGDDEIPPALLESPPAWLERRNVKLKFVPRDMFAKHSFYGTALYRFELDFASDMVLMLDADIVVARPLDDFVRRGWDSNQFAGLIAHGAPFATSEEWRAVYEYMGLGIPELKYEHTGWGAILFAEEKRFCPPYFNLGVLLARRDIMRKVGDQIMPSMERFDTFMPESYFRCQIAVTLALESQHIPAHNLPVRYNFPNWQVLEEKYPDEMAQATIVHLAEYGGDRQGDDKWGVDKWQLYDNLGAIEEFLKRSDLTGLDATLQSVLRSIFEDMSRDQEGVDGRIYSAQQKAV